MFEHLSLRPLVVRGGSVLADELLRHPNDNEDNANEGHQTAHRHGDHRADMTPEKAGESAFLLAGGFIHIEHAERVFEGTPHIYSSEDESAHADNGTNHEQGNSESKHIFSPNLGWLIKAFPTITYYRFNVKLLKQHILT